MNYMKKVLKWVGIFLLAILGYNAIKNMIDPLPEYHVLFKNPDYSMMLAEAKGHTHLAYKGVVILLDSIPSSAFDTEARRIMEKEYIETCEFFTSVEAWRAHTKGEKTPGYMGKIEKGK
jgi:putative Mn2+ efflux pump MntP